VSAALRAGALTLILGAIAGCSGATEPAPPVSGTPSPTAESTETATPTASVASPPATTPERSSIPQAAIGSPIDLSGEFLVVIVGIGTDAPPGEVERRSVRGGQVLNRATSLTAADFEIDGSYINSWRNIHYPPAATGTAAMAAVCSEGDCGGLGFADPSARTTLVRSTDLGRTWQRIAVLDGAFWLWSWSPDGSEALLWRYPTQPPFPGPRPAIRWPSMVEVAPPSRPDGSSLLDTPPLLLADGRVAWWTETGLFDEDSAMRLDFGALADPPRDPVSASISPDGARLIVSAGLGGPTRRWSLFELTDAGTYVEVTTLRQPSEFSIAAVPYLWLDDHRVVVPAGGEAADLGLPPGTFVGAAPAVVDFSTAEVRLIAGFEAPDVVGRGNLVIGYEPSAP